MECLNCSLYFIPKLPTNNEIQLQQQLNDDWKAKLMRPSKARAIALDWIGVDSILDATVPETFYFKHDVGASLIIILATLR